MTIKRGYHRMKTPKGRVVDGPLVVETTKEGVFLSYHFLHREEADTEWIGGTYLNF